jgi:hypothetical protein
MPLRIGFLIIAVSRYLRGAGYFILILDPANQLFTEQWPAPSVTASMEELTAGHISLTPGV